MSVPANASYITGTSVVVEVNASKIGFSAPSAITRSLTVDLTAPTAPGYTAPTSLKVGEAISPMSPSGGVGIDEYGATGLPSGLSLDTGTGAIGGTPDTADANTTSVTVTVSDTAGNEATATISFPAVAKGDQALSGFQYSASSVTYGSNSVPTVTAPSGAATTISYSATPATVCRVDPSTGALTLAGAGTCVVTATAAGSDDYNEATASYTVTVQPTAALVLNLNAVAGDNTVNIAEKAAGFTIGGDTGSVGGVSVTVTVGSTELTATSADADPATWSVSVPANASYITGTSVVVEVNASKIGFSAPSAITRSLTVDLTAPTAPGYTAPTSLKVGEAISPMSPSGGVGIDEYGATGLPSGLSLDTGTGSDRRHAGYGGCQHNKRHGDGERHGRQRGDGDDQLPCRGQGRPGAERVPVQRVLGDLREQLRAHRHRAQRRCDDNQLLRHTRHGMQGGPVHGRAHPGGRGHLRGHRDRRGQRRLQRSDGELHGDGAAHRRAGAEPQRRRR